MNSGTYFSPFPRKYFGEDDIHNNPVNATDPSGKIVVIIHGIRDDGTTWADRVYGGLLDGWREMQKRDAELGMRQQTQNQEALMFVWRGPVFGKPWLLAATPTASPEWLLRRPFVATALRQFVSFLHNLRRILPADEPINVLAHSQGTNITLAAMRLGAPINNAVLINSPLNVLLAEREVALATENSKGRVYHYWSPDDRVVKLKGGGEWRFRQFNPSVKEWNIKDRAIQSRLWPERNRFGHGDALAYQFAKEFYSRDLATTRLTDLNFYEPWRRGLPELLRAFPTVSRVTPRGP